MTDHQIMTDLLNYARGKFDTEGVLPFCAYVARDGVLIAKGYYDKGDSYGAPTNHGEMNAIRKACKSFLTYENLAGCDLYTTCEPCLACLETALLVGIRRIVFAATHEDSALDVFFNDHTYYPADFAHNHPDMITLVVSDQRQEAVQLFAAARQKYGF